MKRLIIHQMPWIKRPIACKIGHHKFGKPRWVSEIEWNHQKKNGVHCEECSECNARIYINPVDSLEYLSAAYSEFRPDSKESAYQIAIASILDADAKDFQKRYEAYVNALKDEKEAKEKAARLRKEIFPSVKVANSRLLLDKERRTRG